MKINEIILKAIKAAVSDLGSQVELAERSGLPKQHINQYISGKVKGINKGTWAQLYPNIKKYLPENYLNVSGGSIGHVIQGGTNVGNHQGGGENIYKEKLTAKILNNKELNAEEKVKMLKLLNE